MKKFLFEVIGKTTYTIFAEDANDAEDLIKDIGAASFDTFEYKTTAVEDATSEEIAAISGEQISTKGMA